MSTAFRQYTPAEAAAVSGIGLKSIHNAIDKQIIEARVASRHRGALTDNELLRLKIWYEVGSVLTADRRKRLFDAIRDDPLAATVKADEFLIVDFARAREQLATHAQALREAETIIQSIKGVLGSEPVFKRTHVPARAIAAMMAQGATPTEILEGYPSISSRMMELAEIWTAAHPARGRPRKLSQQGLTPKLTKRFPLKGHLMPKASGVSS